MSFILDALKKSEAERQRQSGPALMEVRLVPPRRRFPAWWIGLGVLLGGNLWLLLWLGLRTPTPALSMPLPATSTAALTAPATAPVIAPLVAPGVAPAAAGPAAAGPAAATGVATAPAVAAVTAPATGNNTDLDAVAGDNPDLEPARAPEGSVRRENTTQSLRNYSELNGNLPDLRLDLHVYATRPADRYALINMHKVHEGDVLPEGPRVSEITRDGVVLSYRGDEFLLGRD